MNEVTPLCSDAMPAALLAARLRRTAATYDRAGMDEARDKCHEQARECDHRVLAARPVDSAEVAAVLVAAFTVLDGALGWVDGREREMLGEMTAVRDALARMAMQAPNPLLEELCGPGILSCIKRAAILA